MPELIADLTSLDDVDAAIEATDREHRACADELRNVCENWRRHGVLSGNEEDAAAFEARRKLLELRVARTEAQLARLREQRGQIEAHDLVARCDADVARLAEIRTKAEAIVSRVDRSARDLAEGLSKLAALREEQVDAWRRLKAAGRGEVAGGSPDQVGMTPNGRLIEDLIGLHSTDGLKLWPRP